MPALQPELPLKGIGILVTRPREQAETFMNELRSLGGVPVPFPVLAILPPRDASVLMAQLQHLPACQLAIFISPTAVSRGLACLHGPWPTHVRVAAVGRGTAQALHAQGFADVIVPATGGDSEHLLALPALQAVDKQRIGIFRGEGGRETLAETLSARGAEVVYVECYRRGLPEPVPDPHAVLAAFSCGAIQAVTVFSSETLDNLMLLLGASGRAALCRIPLFVPHPRIARHAHELGVEIVQVPQDGEPGILSGLVKYFAHD